MPLSISALTKPDRRNYGDEADGLLPEGCTNGPAASDRLRLVVVQGPNGTQGGGLLRTLLEASASTGIPVQAVARRPDEFRRNALVR